MERQAKETLLRFPYIPKKEARTVAWSNLKFISHLYLQSCKLLEHLCYTAQENYLNKAVQTHVWNVCRQTNRMSVIPFPSALWSWIHVTRLLMLCPVHLNPPETEILQVLLNADCCNALSSGQESQESTCEYFCGKVLLSETCIKDTVDAFCFGPSYLQRRGLDPDECWEPLLPSSWETWAAPGSDPLPEMNGGCFV
ncbi:uncharacterized protein [Aphelocoma coerulescens]|uniref:uncharacterized protein isoform X4 n=1 Tax=Aphelocoma coerulescens TaxID=39617 RepID=UPI003604F354